MNQGLDATELYIELLSLSAADQRERLAQIAQLDRDLANDLADMLALNVTELNDDGLRSFVRYVPQESDLTGYCAMGFEIVAPLSESGGMGRIYLGEQIVNGAEGQTSKHQAAIKVLRKEVISAQRLEKYFFREASSLIELDHPNICRVYGFDNIQGSACIVMEYIQGVTLEAWLAHNPTLNERIAILHQLCQALEYAHSRHIFHADLKPQNVMVTSSNRLKVIDLGLAKRIEQSQISSGEQAYIQGYSEQWSSPEQKKGRWSYSQSDVFSLGLLIEALFTGVVLKKQTRAEFNAIITKATELTPQARYFSAAELYLDLSRALNHYPVDVYRQDVFYRLQKQFRRHPWRFGSVAIGVASAAIFVGLTLNHNAQLMRKQRSSEQIIAQMEQTLSNNLPSLSYYYQSQSVDSLYQFAAKNWLKGEAELEPEAKYQTGLGLISGLFDTQQIKLAKQLLSVLVTQPVNRSEKIVLDGWGFRLAGASYIETNYALGGSYSNQEKWLANPELIEPTEFDQNKLDDYLTRIDNNQLENEELLTAFYALGVIRPYQKEQQTERYNKLQQRLLSWLETSSWQTLSINQQIEQMSLFASYVNHNIILSHLAIEQLQTPLPDAVDREVLRLAQNNVQYSLGTLTKLQHIMTRSHHSQVREFGSQVAELLTSQTDRQPTELLTMTKTAGMMMVATSYAENRQLLQDYQETLLAQFSTQSANLYDAVNRQALNALELGLIGKAEQIGRLVEDVQIVQNPQYSQSGLLRSNILLDLYQRELTNIETSVDQYMQFELQRFKYYLDYIGEVSDEEKRNHFALEYPLLLAASNHQWSRFEEIIKQNKLTSIGWRAFSSYLYQMGGESGKALAIFDDIPDVYQFRDVPIWLAEDVKNEVLFFYGRKLPGRAHKALIMLRQQAELQRYDEKAASYHAAKNYLFQLGLALRSGEQAETIHQLKQWLQQSTGVQELPTQYQDYYQRLIEL
ncbi:hypothetical protein BIY22_06100 [Vibrio panuliri]|uniref:Protein kinase domain-containing protein n=1 Tax=Vibrio panuliri TaxID=1381081 RepID=A0A1Q9HJS8_9VIBR|nr:serine/threonine-protein kinase [Vibrio panuliri]OLQ90563.1 hypothetical protein BIY22_06100 [Vibrio panuliri]